MFTFCRAALAFAIVSRSVADELGTFGALDNLDVDNGSPESVEVRNDILEGGGNLETGSEELAEDPGDLARALLEVASLLEPNGFPSGSGNTS